MKGNRKLWKIGSAVAAVFVAAVVVGVSWQAGGANRAPSPEALPATESLAVEAPAQEGDAVAQPFEPASVEKLADVLHVERGDGEQLALSDVDPADYSGFLFELDDLASDAGNAAGKVADAIDAGIVEEVHDGLYRADSLDDLAGLFSSDQLAYVEPDFRMHLIGDVETEGAAGIESAAGADSTASTGAATPNTPEASLAQLLDQSAITAQGGTTANPAPDWPVNDAAYAEGKLFHLDMLNVQGAWEAGLDGDPYYYNGKPLHADADGNPTPVKVAVIDTGLYGTGEDEPAHEDFDYNRMKAGYDFIHGDSDSCDDAHGHGTFVAGLIAAEANNNVGVAGLTPGVTVISEKVFDTGSAATSDVVGGIYHAVDEAKVDVINMSLGGEYNDNSLKTACQYAVDQGVLVVASAGNDGISTPNYPAAYDTVVGVASINQNYERSTWSQFGASVFVTAVGEAVTSTFNEGATSYKTASGTSFSGPEVAALAAMCRAVYPDMDQQTFMDFLVQTSTDMGTKGYDDYYGYGLVNFQKMAEMVLASQVLPYYDITFSVTDEDGHAVEGAQVTLTAAENIAWDADPDEGITAGAWPEGTQITPADGQWPEGNLPADGVYRLHRGTYSYTITCDGKYTTAGTFKTYTQNQTVPVTMQAAYETAISVVDSAGAPVEGAALTITSLDGRVEQPKATSGTTATFDLASGRYAYEASAEGYEVSSGSFVVQRIASERAIALYRASELSTVTFDCVDAADGTTVAGSPTIVVTDDSGNVVNMNANANADAQPGTGAGYRLAKGHDYTVTASKAGYEDASQGFTVGAGDSQIVTVRMTKARFVVTFDVRDGSGATVSTATVKVADGEGNQMEANAGNPLRYNLNQGQYSYLVEAPGYDSAQGAITVAYSSHTVTVQLAAQSQKVTFDVTDAQTGDAIEGASTKVSKAGLLRAIAANADGSYSLAPGDYTYTVYKNGYAAATGDFTVAGEALSITVALTPRASGDIAFAGGSGTEDDPYLIATEEQLRGLAAQTEIVRMTKTDAETNQRGEVGGFYKLIDDIELSDEEWLPIGNCEFSSNCIAFTGTFDGDGHTVSNVHLSNTYDYQGFFGYVHSATIKNLTVEGTIRVDGKNGSSGGSYVGGIVGGVRAANDELYTSSNTGPTTISRCCNRIDVTGRAMVGGIVGSAQMTLPSTGLPEELPTDYYIDIVECVNEGNVSAAYRGEFVRQGLTAGGIVGSAQLVGITSCYNAGTVQSGYTAGGIAGRGNFTGIFSCYSSGQVMQYVSGSGYANMTGALIGTSAKTNAADSYALKRDDNYVNTLVGAGDSSSSFVACEALDYADMYRTDAFLAKVNADTPGETTRDAYVLGRDFPLLAWQVAEGALLAPMPHIVVQPAGVAEDDAYVQGSAADPITAEIEDVSEGTVTWQWYASDAADGSGGEALAGMSGIGTTAMLVPPTDEAGRAYYYVAFTNTVYRELESDTATAKSKPAAIYVRSSQAAHEPRISAVNPNQTSDFNYTLTVNQASDCELEVLADTDDGGQLSYQWYKATSQSGGEAIEGATGPACRADTANVGTTYYYVTVTNRTGYGNTASVTSDWITVTVESLTISSYEELASFRDSVNTGTTYQGLVVTLDADIAIPAGVSWEPIGTRAHPFMGTFQGGSGRPGTEAGAISTHTISGVSVDGDALGNQYLGLFGFTQGASIYDVQVGGSVTGAANTYAGLLVGWAYSGTNSEAAIGNCATLPGSSVEGKYQIGGIAGLSSVSIENCANHASVTGCAYAYTQADADSGSTDYKAVGGVVGRQNSGMVAWSYNDGAVSVDAVGEGQDRCAAAVGGVVGNALYAAAVSCYNAGPVTAANKAAAGEATRVRFGGSVGGYLTSYANVHYLDGSYTEGVYDEAAGTYVSEPRNIGCQGGSYEIDYAVCHSQSFMDTAYFAKLMNTGYASYPTDQFVQSAGAAPHLAWEADTSEPRTGAQSAEPWIDDFSWADVPDLTSTFAGTVYQGFDPQPIYTHADSPDGGALTVRWQVRDQGADDDAWADVPGSAVELSAEDSVDGQAAFTFPNTEVGTREYRVYVANKRADVAEADDKAEDDRASVGPAFTITVKSSEGIVAKADPSAPSSADNPWVVENADQLAFLASVVNGDEPYWPGIDDSTFKGQYVQLANDIALPTDRNWTPIGIDDAGYHKADFQGTFDGGGHTVSGLTLTGDYDLPSMGFLGLFGAVNGAVVKNLAVEGVVSVEGGNAWAIGGVCGYAVNSTFENVVNRANVTAHDSFGGVCGYAGGATFTDCENAGAVTINESARADTYGPRGIGGILGRAFDTRTSTLERCYNSGTVTGRIGSDSEYYFGAIVGKGAFSVANCYYQAGSVVDADDGPYPPTGRGGSAAGPAEDRTGIVEAVDCANADGGDALAAELAWKLNTANGANATSRLWGSFAGAADGSAVQPHLVMGDGGMVVYRVDTSSEAASITANPAYARMGDEVSIGWKKKPGYTIDSVGWKVAGADDDSAHSLGTGNESLADAVFAMPADDVEIAVAFTRDTSYRYPLATSVVYDGSDAPAGAATVALATEEEGCALGSEQVGVTLSVAAGYQVRSVEAIGQFGTPIAVERVDGLHYRFEMPTENVNVRVTLEDVGTAAEARAESLEATTGALHYRHSDAVYANPNLLYATTTLSGSFFGEEKYYTTTELERLGATASYDKLALYEQSYTFGDGSARRFTGVDLAALIRQQAGYSEPAADVPVVVETAAGESFAFTYGDIASLSYNAYGDATGQPTTRGLPVLLFFGVDGVPSTDGAVGVVFGQAGPGDDNASRLVRDVTRICVGDDVNYSQHVWGGYEDMDLISGGTTNGKYGYTDLTVRVYQGTESNKSLISEDVMSLTDIEKLARANRGGIQHGTYSTALYQNDASEFDGPYADYYEGYDLMSVLEYLGVYYVDADMAAATKVQFYQTGMNGLANSRKTVDVSLAYLAGNGPAGVGDYSGNYMQYVTGSDGVAAPGAGRMTGLRPMLVYGKNGLPLVWSSGQASYLAYNYRGPMMAFLPQNDAEGGAYVGANTATACYLALIEVYVPNGVDYPERASAAAVSSLGSAASSAAEAAAKVVVSKDGSDVAAGTPWVTKAALDALNAAIAEAERVAALPAATASQVARAQNGLREAQEAFAAATFTYPNAGPGTWSTSKDGKKYYIGKDGKPVTGFATIAGKAYYFDAKTGALATGFVTVSGKRYYADASGVVKTGKFKVGAATYYADASGAIQTGWIKAGSAYYYANASGVLQKGSQKISGARYYFDTSSFAAKTGLYTVGSASYYGAAKGLVKTGLFTVGGARYYANASGALQKGWITVGKAKYYANAKYVLVKGNKKISGKRYFFDTSTCKMKTGKFKSGKKTYYATKAGVLKTGLFKMGKAYYYASKKGVLQKGLKKIKGKRYYFNKKTFKAAKGKYKVGKKYYYGTKKGLRKTGWVKAGKAKYYANKKGVLQKGWKKIKGKYYYFDKKTYKMAKSKWVGKYYVNAKGVRTKTRGALVSAKV